MCCSFDDEYNGSGTLQRTFVWGNYIDEALRMRAGGSDYYYLHDHLYSPAVLIGYESGQWRPVERYEYDAYGTARVINRGPDNAWFTADDVVTGSSAINTTLFTGRTLDALDSGGLKIMYYRNRYTDPFAGRFLQQDPMGYKDGLNLYEYTISNPIVYSDPWGQECEIVQYKNPGFTGHSGILVGNNDYDFGPTSVDIITGMKKGSCPWSQGGPGDSGDGKVVTPTKRELKIKKHGYLYGNFAKNTGIPLKKCACATCSDIAKCVADLCSAYDGQPFQFPISTCRSFVRDAKNLCCLTE